MNTESCTLECGHCLITQNLSARCLARPRHIITGDAVCGVNTQLCVAPQKRETVSKSPLNRLVFDTYFSVLKADIAYYLSHGNTHSPLWSSGGADHRDAVGRVYARCTFDALGTINDHDLRHLLDSKIW